MDLFSAGGREVLADIIRADRELAMAAVDQDRKLNSSGPSE
jgi:hypothetical protein